MHLTDGVGSLQFEDKTLQFQHCEPVQLHLFPEKKYTRSIALTRLQSCSIQLAPFGRGKITDLINHACNYLGPRGEGGGL